MRDLILVVYGGDDFNLPFLYTLVNHIHAKPIFEMLIRRGMVGNVLSSFIKNELKSEQIRFLDYCLKTLHNVNKAKTPKVSQSGILS